MSVQLLRGDKSGVAALLALVRGVANVNQNVVQQDLFIPRSPVDATLDGASRRSSNLELGLIKVRNSLLIDLLALTLACLFGPILIQKKHRGD